MSDGDGSKVDPLIWDQGSKAKVRNIYSRVVVDLAGLPGPPGFLDNALVSLESGPVTDTDVRNWPFSVSFGKIHVLAFLRLRKTLNEMGKFRVSYLEMLILFERWIGHRLLPEKTVPKNCRCGRVITTDSAPISEGFQIRHGCQFIGSLFRSLALVVWVGLSLVRLAPISVGYVILVGCSVVMVSLAGR